jgi:hypothetical protein
MIQSDLLTYAPEALLSNQNNLSPTSLSSHLIFVPKHGTYVRPALQSVPTLLDDDPVPLDSDHQSHVPQVRRLDANHDLTGLSLILSLPDSEIAG